MTKGLQPSWWCVILYLPNAKVEVKLRFEQILKNRLCWRHWSSDKGVLVGKKLGGPGCACLLTQGARPVGRSYRQDGPKLGIRVETIPTCLIVPSNTVSLKHSKAWLVREILKTTNDVFQKAQNEKCTEKRPKFETHMIVQKAVEARSC